ncbi:hypothetical protein [Rufibacter immobilis]
MKEPTAAGQQVFRKNALPLQDTAGRFKQRKAEAGRFRAFFRKTT